MKKRLFGFIKEALRLAVIVAAVSLALDWWRSPSQRIEHVSDMTLKTYDGTPLSLQKGAPLLLYFWMPHCSVCKHNMSAVKAVFKRYRVVSVASFAHCDEVRRAAARYALPFPVVCDEKGTVAERFGVKVFPTFFIYDATGKRRYVTSGYTTQAGLIARLLLASRRDEATPR